MNIRGITPPVLPENLSVFQLREMIDFSIQIFFTNIVFFCG